MCPLRAHIIPHSTTVGGRGGEGGRERWREGGREVVKEGGREVER